MNTKHYEIPLLPGEFWWGGSVSDGIRTPFGGSLFSRDLNNLEENQGVPLLISNKGRYIWCNSPYSFKFQDKTLTIASNENIIFEEGFENLRTVYKHVSHKYFPPAGKLPDELAFLSPQYNTWIEMFYKPTQEKVLSYANSIIENGMPPGIMIIDDNWMKDYGNWDFSDVNFPGPKKLIDTLHELGFKVMLWVCPYVSPDSCIFRELQAKELLLKTNDGTPAIRRWWNGYSAVLDYTNSAAVQWFKAQLQLLINKYGVDGFKFDAGDPSGADLADWNKPYSWEFLPYPNYDCEAYAKIGLDYSLSEYRACWGCGGRHLIQRQKDKKPAWAGNGLDSLIPNGLLQGLIGYPFNCPDMIGGGMEGDINSPDFKIDQELFVRFLQCSLLFPIIQFSIAPWRVLDKEHFKYCSDMIELRQKLAPGILELARNSAGTGQPVIRHMEYVFPGCNYERINDQFMLGDDILVAPVLEKGARGRAVTFPAGIWVGDDGSNVLGPAVKDIKVPLGRLPYYIKKAD